MSLNRPKRSKRSRWGIKGLWALLLVALAAGGGAAWYFTRAAGGAADQALVQSTQTAVVKRGTVRITASGSGTLAAIRSADLSFSTGGTISELNVKLGDLVQAGDVLARLSSAEDLEASLASAELQLFQARQSLETIQQNADLDLAQAYLNKLSAQDAYAAALRASQKTVGRRCSREVTMRYATLLETWTERLARMEDMEHGSEAWIEAKNNYDNALANYDYCAGFSETEKLTAQSELDIAQVNLRSAEKLYQTLKESSGIDPAALALAEAEVTSAERQVASTKKNLEGIVLIAPFDGRVTYLAAGAGAVVDTSKYLTIADLSTLVVNVSIDENDVDKLAVGSPATVTFDVLPDQLFAGVVVQVNPQLVTSGQYSVAQGLVALDEASTRVAQNLLLGLNASVELLGSTAEDVLVVPVAALRNQGSGQYAVMVVDSSGQTALRPVEIGLKDSNFAEIRSGLEAGETVSSGLTLANAGSASPNANSAPSSLQVPGEIPPDGGMMPLP